MRSSLKRTPLEQQLRTDGKTGILYLVATPIGNLEDITLRALKVLSQVDLIIAEDTRTTRKLLAAHSIQRPLLGYHEQGTKWEERAKRFLDMLLDGKDLALVSEAGTPGISDPGHGLVRLCIERGIPIYVIPGPSVIVSALVLSGLPVHRFAFEGFVPRKTTQRKEYLASLKNEPRTMVFFESPRRLLVTLRDMIEAWGDRKAAVIREMTKLFEEVRRGTLSELAQWSRGKDIKGEITIVVEGRPRMAPSEELLEERARFLVERCGLSEKQASIVIQEETGTPRKSIYNIFLRLKNRGELKDNF